MLREKLHIIAFKLSKPFCYGCYTHAIETAHGPRCPKCHSDDLMRITEDDGPEWGVDWLIPNILANNCTQISEEEIEERFMDMLNDCHGKVTVGGYEWDHGEAFKKLDPVAFDLELAAYIDDEIENDILITFDNGASYFQRDEVERFIDQQLERSSEESST